MELLKSTLEKIGPLNDEFEGAAKAHLDNLTKPVGSLGRLEEFARKEKTSRSPRSQERQGKQEIAF